VPKISTLLSLVAIGAKAVFIYKRECLS